MAQIKHNNTIQLCRSVVLWKIGHSRGIILIISIYSYTNITITSTYICIYISTITNPNVHVWGYVQLCKVANYILGVWIFHICTAFQLHQISLDLANGTFMSCKLFTQIGWTITEPTHEIMVLFILRKPIFQTRMRSHPMGLNVWFFGLFPYFMSTNREGSGETARMRRLAWAFASRLCDKYHNLMSWLNLTANRCHWTQHERKPTISIHVQLDSSKYFNWFG